ncbi:MAG: hypothetical protein GX998_03855 [Firmicutes bacterium]|nr:hypothetical protein [Bacillota bacterium]
MGREANLREVLREDIIAVVTEDRTLAGGGAPIFYAGSAGEKEKLALDLSRVTRGMVHQLDNGVYIVVRH